MYITDLTVSQLTLDNNSRVQILNFGNTFFGSNLKDRHFFWRSSKKLNKLNFFTCHDLYLGTIQLEVQSLAGGIFNWSWFDKIRHSRRCRFQLDRSLGFLKMVYWKTQIDLAPSQIQYKVLGRLWFLSIEFPGWMKGHIWHLHDLEQNEV